MEAGRLLDLQVLDHLIVSPDGFYSFGDEGVVMSFSLLKSAICFTIFITRSWTKKN